MVSDNVCLGVMSTNNLLSCDKSESPLVEEIPRRGTSF